MDAVRREREEAWIGDAVLALWARGWILRRLGCLHGEILVLATSNHFLSRFGRPTAVEARIGRIFESDGLEAAEQWLQENLEEAMILEIRRKFPNFAGKL